MKEIKSEYDKELDILHVYSEEVKNGIKGCISFGDFNLDVGMDNKIIGIELEEASKNINLSPEILSSPDEANLIVRNMEGGLFAGINILKGQKQSSIQVTTQQDPTLMKIAC